MLRKVETIEVKEIFLDNILLYSEYIIKI